MALQRAGFFQNALGAPAQFAKMHRQRDRRKPAGGREPQPIPSGMSFVHADRQRPYMSFHSQRECGCKIPRIRLSSSREHRSRPARLRRWRIPPPLPPQSQERNPAQPPPHRIPTQDWRRSQASRILKVVRTAAHPANPFSAASTAAGVASTATALRRKRFDLLLMPGNFIVSEQRSAMEVDGVVGVLQRMPGKQQHHSLAGGHLSLGAQFLQARKGHGRSGFTAQAFGAKLGLGNRDLCLGDIEAPAACVLDRRAQPCATKPDCRCESPSRACALPPAPSVRRCC